MKEGDTIEVEISGIGKLVNTIENEVRVVEARKLNPLNFCLIYI